MASKDLINKIWSIADILRGTYKQSEYGKVILIFTLLRRLDQVFESKKKEVIEKINYLEENGIQEIDNVIRKTFEIPFYNHSKFDLQLLKSDPNNIAINFNDYINGYSESIFDILTYYESSKVFDKLIKTDLIYEVVSEFTNINLDPSEIDNYEISIIYEELLRRFTEITNIESGQHFTPRDVVELMTSILFLPTKKELQSQGLVRSIYDPCCGTGGMLTLGKKYIKDNINKSMQINLYGQELNDQTLAICKSDLIVSGEDHENIKGPKNTLTEDMFQNKKFDFIISNPPFGTKWKKEKDFVLDEHNSQEGRFNAGVPNVEDGSLLFLQHIIDKMDPNGSKAAIILSNSAFNAGRPGGGESNIRKNILEKDLIESIIMLPDSLFYNTFITTFILVLNNKKHVERKKKIQLINCSNSFKVYKNKLNFKHKYIPQNEYQKILNNYEEFQENKNSIIVNNDNFLFKSLVVDSQLYENKKPVYLKNGEPKPDISKRNKFYKIPIDYDENEYFEKNIKPHFPNAWLATNLTKIGCEMHLPLQFYQPNKLKDKDIIKNDFTEFVKIVENLKNSK
jgi:type I restriction enzyme M protein